MLERITNFFTGGPNVWEAQRTIEELSRRHNLSSRNQQRLKVARGITRRHFLKLAISSVLVVGSAGATGTSLLLSDNETPNEPDITLIGKGIDYENVLKYHPELKDENLFARGQFESPVGNISWYNFTKKQFNEADAKVLFDFLDKVAKEGISGVVQVEGSSKNYRVIPRERKPVIIFIVDPKTEDPQIQNKEAKGYTKDLPDTYVITVKAQSREDLTEEQLKLYWDPEGINNKIFANEACQATITTSLTESESGTLRPLKESFCNSIGEATFMAQKGNTYENYAQSIRRSPVISSPFVGDVSLIVVPQEFYNRIPRGKVIQ